jgi:hypothetical protein
MKKTYEKPRICYESFALSDRISAGCEGIANIGENQCSILIPELGETIFNQDLVCSVTSPGGNETICYNAPSEWNNVYSS